MLQNLIKGGTNNMPDFTNLDRFIAETPREYEWLKKEYNKFSREDLFAIILALYQVITDNECEEMLDEVHLKLRELRKE